MESRLSSRWIYLWIFVLFRGISADLPSPPQYILHRTNVTFYQAIVDCSPGVLTTLATQQEVADILKLVSSKSLLEQNRFTFWVGLNKAKNECVVPKLPLRGFKWVVDGSEETQMSLWEEEPEETCTTARCAALAGEFKGSTISSWGLIPISCKTENPFICKLRDGQTAWRPEDRQTSVKPAAPESKPAAPEPESKPAAPEPAEPESKPTAPEPESKPAEPAAPESKPAAPEPESKSAAPEPESKSAAPEPESKHAEPAAPESKPAAPESKPAEPAAPESKPAAPESKPAAPEPEIELKPETGRELPGPNPEPESDLCVHLFVPDARSLSPDPNNSSRIQVECWSSVQLELHCSGRPAVWRLLDDSPANFTTICLPCDNGFQKDASGNCVDINECASGGSVHCRHTCLNTEGSYRCVCSDQDGKHHGKDSQECMETAADANGGSLSGILIPVLVAVAALVVLVVVVAVIVKCCLMRRSKKRAMKKVEKMAMDSKDDKDSFETANEKTPT